MNPYMLPDGPTIINFSGGRTSGYMLYRILDYYQGQLPDNVRVVFANTGVEREETLKFVNLCGVRWSVPIVWLEYRHRLNAKGGRKDPKHHYEIVCYQTASRNGEPYDALIRSKKMLPNVVMRFCTTNLKVEPVRWWVTRGLRWGTEYRSALGIRHDEPKRWGKALMEECQTFYPLVHDKISVDDVMRFWSTHPFDLGLQPGQGNCTLCFLKGKQNIVRLMRENPKQADWWIEKENNIKVYREAALKKKSIAQFSKRWSYTELLSEAMQPENEESREVEETAISCFCGD